MYDYFTHSNSISFIKKNVFSKTNQFSSQITIINYTKSGHSVNAQYNKNQIYIFPTSKSGHSVNTRFFFNFKQFKLDVYLI